MQTHRSNSRRSDSIRAFAFSGIAAGVLLCAAWLSQSKADVQNRSADRPSPAKAQGNALPDPDGEFTELEAQALAIRFELRYSEIADSARRHSRAEIQRSGFALLPARALDSVVERDCLPRMNSLRRRAADYPQAVLAQAIPGELRNADALAVCRRLVYESLCEARPALAPCDPIRLRSQLTAVDRLQFQYQARRERMRAARTAAAPANRADGELAAFAGLENFRTQRRQLLGDAADTALFAVQDDHSRLLLQYASLRTDPATADQSAAERVAHYRRLAASFEAKHGVRLKDYDSEGRDHVARLLELLEPSASEAQNASQATADYEQERYELLKELRGSEAADRDRELRRESQSERRRLAAFESERARRLQALGEKAGRNPSQAARAELRAARSALEAELTEKYFSGR